jgi:hypothetical protein
MTGVMFAPKHLTVVYRMCASRHSNPVDSSGRLGTAQLPVTNVDLDHLTAAFQDIAIVDLTPGPPTTANLSDVLNNEPQKTFPFMKLPAELRCFIYEQVFLDIVQGAEAVAWLTRRSPCRNYEVIPIRDIIHTLPHTCHTIRTESTPIYANLMRTVLKQIQYERKRPTYLSVRRYGLSPEPCEHAIMHCKIYAFCHIGRILSHLLDNFKREQRRLARITIESRMLELCIGAQNRIQSGTGVRASFKAEVRSQCGVEISDGVVKSMIGCMINDRDEIITALDNVRETRANP